MGNFVQQLLAYEKGIVCLSAPTNSGKTALVKTIKQIRANTIIVSAEQLADEIIQQLKTNGHTAPETFFVGYQCVCVEDIDWYRGREYTQFEFASVMGRVADRALVIITGIDLKTRVPELLSRLEYDLFEKTAGAEGWVCCEQKRVPEIYRNRKKLMRVSLDMGISAKELNQLVAPMAGKSEEEKEIIAAQIVQQLLSRK